MKKQTLTISGTTCASCELRIRQEIKRHHCQCHSFSSNKCTISWDDNNISSAIDAIRRLGYGVNETKNHFQRKKPNVLSIIWRLLISGSIVILLMALSWSQAGIVSGSTFWGAIILGLLASCSTCLAVTGWLVMSYGSSVSSNQNTKTQVLFHWGRILGFAIVWWILGLVGSIIVPSITSTIILNTLVAILLLIIGAQGLGRLPPLKSVISLPSLWTRIDNMLHNPRFAPLIGALTISLPCGFTQSMMLIAVTTQSPLLWAGLMTAFALGTTPVLLGLGRWSNWLKDRIRRFSPVLSAIILAFGMYSIINTYALAQAGLFHAVAQDTTVDRSTAQVVEVGHDGVYFSPNRLELDVGVLYRIRVTPTNNWQWCMGAVVYAGKTYPIRKGETFELTVDGRTAWNHRLVCASMGMTMGEIVIQ